jgi:hypothetical protein
MRLFETLHRIEAMTGDADRVMIGDPGPGGYELQMGGWVESGEALAYTGKKTPFYSVMYYQMLHPVQGLVWIPTRSVIEIGEEG